MVAEEYCSSVFGSGVPLDMLKDWIEPSVKLATSRLPWSAMPLIMPPARPLTEISSTKDRLHPGSTWNVPIELEAVKLAYRYWLFTAKPIPLAEPSSVGEPVTLPTTVCVGTATSPISLVEAMETKAHCWS